MIKGEYHFVDPEAIKNCEVPNPEKIKTRVKELAAEYEARKAKNSKTNERPQGVIDKEPLDIFFAEAKEMAAKLDNAKNPEEEKIIAEKLREIYVNIFAMKSAEQKG